MLRLDPLAPDTPRLPHRQLGALAQLAFSAAVHVALVAIVVFITVVPAPGIERSPSRSTEERQVQHLVFLAPELPALGGGGGGGGNQQPAPIRRAQGVGSDAATLPVRRTSPKSVPVPSVENPPDHSLLLDAKPLASGFFDQVGLPIGGLVSGTSTGPGSGGGVGTGIGTGIGPGRGSGLGPGSGGGTGGGVYRVGGAVSAPRLITQVRPRYTGEALRKNTQGTVVLEAVVTSEGCASQFRVVRSLDPGLDEEAVAAVGKWRFEPGRLADGTAVDVLVTIMVDFTLR